MIDGKKNQKNIVKLTGCTYICSHIAAYMKLRRDVFQAIADPTRRAILGLVALNAMTPGAIAASFEVSRQTVSKHIQILTQCELLVGESQGREVYYHFNPVKLKEIANFIEPFRAMWEERFNSLEDLMKNELDNKA